MKDQLVFDTTDASTIADSDSVGAYLRSSDGTRITHTTDGSAERLDANLGIEYDEDAAHTSGDRGAFVLAVANHTEGALHSADGDYAALQVDDTGRLRVVADVDVSNLSEKNEDDPHSSGDTGSYVLAVRQDTLAAATSADGDYASFKVDSVGSLYVKATDSDALLTTIDADTSIISAAIKNEDDAAASGDAGFPGLAVRQDTLASSTSADGDYGHMKQNSLGELYVKDTDVLSEIQSITHDEDTAHTSGDAGVMSLAVRNDTLAALAGTDGDYAPLQVDADGALYVTSPSSDDALANTAIANAANPLTVANTAEDVVAAPLASRKYLYIYNNGNRRAFIGATGVTSANGFPLAPRSYLELRAGASVDIEWVSVNTSQEIRTLELS